MSFEMIQQPGFIVDTYQTESIWEMAACTPNLKGVLIEVSFPDSMMDLAVQSKHLTPKHLAEEYLKIGNPELSLFVYHMKPAVRDPIIQEISQLNFPDVTILQEGQVIDI